MVEYECHFELQTWNVFSEQASAQVRGPSPWIGRISQLDPGLFNRRKLVAGERGQFAVQ